MARARAAEADAEAKEAIARAAEAENEAEAVPAPLLEEVEVRRSVCLGSFLSLRTKGTAPSSKVNAATESLRRKSTQRFLPIVTAIIIMY